MSEGRIKVLYVAGLGRSGSTLLGNVLGQVEDFVSVGEVRTIWQHGLIQNKVCGCGRLFSECEFWQLILDEAYGGMGKVDPYRMTELRESWARTKHIPLMLTPPGKRLISQRLAEYVDNLERLYRAVQTTTDSRVIVDTSKFPSYGFTVSLIPSVDLHVVHLVRDPRAVAHSWLRKKLMPDPETPEYIPRDTPTGTSMRWTARNLGTELFWRCYPERYLLLRYEDFVAQPQKALRRVLELVDESSTPLPHVAEHEVELGINHNIWGNPNRFQGGPVQLRPDDEWIFKMRQRDKSLVTLLTLLLLTRYGYPISSAKATVS
jgi:hypothetical protein